MTDHIPVQSPPTNLVAFTVGAADGTLGVVAADPAGVSAITADLPLVGSAVFEANVTAPMMASAPAAVTSDICLSETFVVCIRNPR
jgi:hypothetical protein